MAEKFEQKDMTGVLFVNERKQNQNHPDYTGKLKVDGRLWDISAWEKQSRNGGTFLSLAIKTEWKPDPSKAQGEKSYKIKPFNRNAEQVPLGAEDESEVPF